MKKFVAIFLTFILIFSFTLPSYATTLIEGLDQVKPSSTFDPNLTSNRGETYDDNSKEAEDSKFSAFTQIFVDIVNEIIALLTAPLSLIPNIFPTIEETIWGQSDLLQITFFDSNPGTSLAGSFKGLVGSCYNALRYLTAAFYIIILVYLGIRMILSSVGKQKARYKEFLKYWLTGLILLFAFHWVMAFMIWGSDTLTYTFAKTGENALSSKLLSSVIEQTGLDNLGVDSGKNVITNKISGMIGSQLIAIITPIPKIVIAGVVAVEFIILALFELVIAFTYLKRLFTIALLIVLFPVVVLSYVFDKIGDRRAQTFGIWFKEFAVNLFIQPIHALLLLFVAFILRNIVFEIPVINVILALLTLTLIPIGEKQIKSLFQISSSMGPGNGGIAGSVAHAGMAVRTLQSLGSSLVDIRKKGLSLKSAETFTKEIINRRGEKAYKEALNSGKSENEAKSARTKAEKEFSSKLASSSKYKKKMKELTGHNSIEAAKKANTLRLTSGITGGAIGAGYALATSTSFGDLFGNIAKGSISGAAIGNSLGNTVHDFSHLGKPLDSPELDEVERLSEGDLSKLSVNQKKQISSILNINVDAINNSKKSKDLIKRKIKARREGLKYGLNYDDPNISYLEEDYDEIQSIMNGLDPKDPSKKIAWNKFKKCVTKDGMYLQDTRDGGKLYHIPDLSNSKASEKMIWQDADKSNEEFKSLLKERALTLTNDMADNGAFERGSKQYKDFLKNEQKDMAEHYSAHVKTTNALELVNHNIMAHRSQRMYSSVNKRITNIDDIRKYLSTEELSNLNSSIIELQQNLDFDPGNVHSRVTVLDTIKNLYNNGSKLSVTKICTEYGINYDEIENGTVENETLKNISDKIQQRVGGETFRVAYANKLDLNARANETISTIITDEIIPQRFIDFAVNNATKSNITTLDSRNLQTFLANSTTTEKQQFINVCNQLMAEEHVVSPHSSTVAYANKEGKINTNVNISNASTDIAQLLGTSTQTLGTFHVSPINPDTQKSVVTFIANGDNSKTFTFESDIDTGGDINSTYAAKCEVGANGELIFSRSDEELEYSFEEQASNDEGDFDKDFNEFTLDELQSYIKNYPNASAHTQFTVIKNSDICAVIDDATNTVLFVKEGLPSVSDKPMQFTIKADNNKNLKIILNEQKQKFANIDVFNRYRLTNHSRDHKGDAKLVEKLLGK